MHVTVNDIDLESDKDSIIVEQLVVDKTWRGLDPRFDCNRNKKFLLLDNFTRAMYVSFHH